MIQHSLLILLHVVLLTNVYDNEEKEYLINNSDEAELYEIAIKKEFQGKKLSLVLMDYFLDFCKSKNVGTIFLEVNTIPGMTATSRYPSMISHAGFKFNELIDRLIELALNKYPL